MQSYEQVTNKTLNGWVNSRKIKAKMEILFRNIWERAHQKQRKVRKKRLGARVGSSFSITQRKIAKLGIDFKVDFQNQPTNLQKALYQTDLKRKEMAKIIRLAHKRLVLK